MERRAGAGAGAPRRPSRPTRWVDLDRADAVRRRLQTIGRARLGRARGRPRPSDDARRPRHATRAGRSRRRATGGWAGYDPVDGAAAVTHLEAQRTRGARYFVLPGSGVQLAAPLPGAVRPPRGDRACGSTRTSTSWSGTSAATRPTVSGSIPPPAARVRVVGTYAGAPHRAAARPGPGARQPASDLVVDQTWRTDADEPAPRRSRVDADYVVHVRDDAILPGAVPRHADRHAGHARRRPPAADPRRRPDGGPPDHRAPRRHRRSRGRRAHRPPGAVRPGRCRPTTVPSRSPTTSASGLRRPLLAARVRRRASSAGPGSPAADGRPMRARPTRAARRPRGSACSSPPTSGPTCCGRAWRRSPSRPSTGPSTRWWSSTTARATTTLAEVLAEVADDLQVVGLRIAHAGRSAAKNHAVLLARAPIVLFFDDDDRAAPDYLERHLAGHAARPDDGVGDPRPHRLGTRARAHPAHALRHRRRPADVRLRAPRRRPGARLARLLGGSHLLQAVAPAAPRPARPAPQLLDRRGDGLAAGPGRAAGDLRRPRPAA